MQNIFNQDFQEFLVALNEADVEYILVGGYSVVLHGYPRTTGDLDVWVNPTIDNYNKLMTAFLSFGLPTETIPSDKFIDTHQFDVFSYGVSPIALDIMTKCKGLNFDDAFSNSIIKEVDGISIRLIHLNDLIIAKKAANRSKDQNDIENLK